MWILKNRPTPTPTPTVVYSVKRTLPANFTKYSVSDQYNKPSNKDMAVCMCFFSPVNSKALLNNYKRVKKSLDDAEIPNYTIELKFSNKLLINDSYFSLFTKSIMFYKENLWNILAEKIPTKYKKLCFLDSDIKFSDLDWYEKTSTLLKTADIVQPYETAVWLDKQNNEIQRSPCVAQFIGFGNELDYSRCHPGFAWAMNRKFFEKIRGFYDRQVLGSGDALFAMALNHNKLKDSDYGYHKSLVDSYDKYLKNIKKQKFKIDYLEDCDATHFYHGSPANRHYAETIIEDLNLYRDSFGVLQWKHIANNQIMLESFRNRKEDE
jgi:hypothetical protein